MSSKYLLPCVCGQQIPIEPRQAGETVACPCGVTVQAPTLREICALEPVQEDASPVAGGVKWGWRQGVLLLGIVTLIAAIGWGVWLCLNPPVSRFDAFDPDLVRQTAKGMPPSLTWDNWEKAKQGLDRRVDQPYAEQLAVYHVQLAMPVLMAIAGAGLIALAMFSATERSGGGRS